MLSERLKMRGLVSDEERERVKKEAAAKDLLEGNVRGLISAMMLVEDDGIMTRKEIEEFVLYQMSFYERQIYSMESDEFRAWLAETLEEEMAIAMSRL